jgi:hypothetical protein
VLTASRPDAHAQGRYVCCCACGYPHFYFAIVHGHLRQQEQQQQQHKAGLECCSYSASGVQPLKELLTPVDTIVAVR